MAALGRERRRGALRVGLDVGRKTARILALSPAENGGYVLRGASAAELSDSLPVEKALRNLWAGLGTRPAGVHCNLGPAKVIVHEAQFPEMPQEDIRSAARIEVGQLIPDVEGMILDFQVIGRFSTAEGSQVGVLIVAAPREAVSARVELLSRARLQALSVVPDGIALANAVAVLRPPEGRAELVLDIGEEATTLVAVMPGAEAVAPVVRYVPGGLRLLAAGEAAPRDTKQSQAEKEQWLQQVERSVEFASGKLGAAAQHILVVGHGADSAELLEWGKQNLAIPLYRWNPLKSLERGRGAPSQQFVKEHGPHMAVAAGLALMEER